MVRGLALSVAMAIAAVSPIASADETPAQRADRLFNEANGFANKGDFASACPRYDESNQLDPAIGTQFNLADCYEHVGRTATALALFRSVERIAGMSGKIERQQSAHQRAEALEKSVARARIVIAAAADVSGLEVLCDDKPVAREDFGRGIALDPGAHTFTARAPGKLDWIKRVDLANNQATEVPVPQLSSAAVATAPMAQSNAWSTQKTLAIVAGGVGIVGLAVGGVAGIVSIVQHGKYTAVCDPGCPTEADVDESRTAVAAGNVSTIGFIAGGVGIAGAAVLWLTAPKGGASTGAALTIAPSVGPARAGLTLGGAF